MSSSSSESLIKERKRNEKKETKDKKDKKEKKEKKDKKEKNDKKEKKEKKEMKEKKEINRRRSYSRSYSREKDKTTSNKKNNYFGKYGIVNISDLFVKVLEFNSWLIEVKNKSKEDLKNIDRKYYDEFIDCYNNCKFSNKKYYNIHKWEAKTKKKLLLKHKRIRKSNDNLKTYHITPDDIEFVFDDEGKKEKEKKLLRELEQKKRLEEAIYNMNKEKADAMKEVDYKNSLMRHYYQTGNMTLAKDLHKQLVGTKNPGNPGDDIPNNPEFSGGEELDI